MFWWLLWPLYRLFSPSNPFSKALLSRGTVTSYLLHSQIKDPLFSIFQDTGRRIKKKKKDINIYCLPGHSYDPIFLGFFFRFFLDFFFRFFTSWPDIYKAIKALAYNITFDIPNVINVVKVIAKICLLVLSCLVFCCFLFFDLSSSESYLFSVKDLGGSGSF